MPMWRCPHCGTPQPEADRCWVCRRSSTCCATCRDYRRAVAAGLGYCGLDRRRRPLTGHETLPCWTAAGTAAGTTAADIGDGEGSGRRPAGPLPTRTGVRNRREFIPLSLAEPATRGAAGTAVAPSRATTTGRRDGTDEQAIADGPLPGWSLFPELDD